MYALVAFFDHLNISSTSPNVVAVSIFCWGRESLLRTKPTIRSLLPSYSTLDTTLVASSEIDIILGALYAS